jgi:triosephosphate isomerase (TIM)
MRKKLLLGNWKMNVSIAEATTFATASIPLVAKAKAANVLIGIAPTYLSLATVKQHNPDLIVSAQNMYFESNGAFTGEISTSMLKELGVDWTLIGHSERRSYFGETNLICNKKMIKASQEGFTAVYCIGESSDDYDHGRTKAVIRDQLLIGLAGLSSEQMQKVVIAYEPVWSIGTGKNASKEHAQDIANYIRERLEEMFDPRIAEATLVLYGGSVKPNNIKDYLTQPDVDGALVGGASLKVSSFEELLTNMIG